MSTPPPLCHVCLVSHVAWTTPRVEFCYRCLPGGPFTPPPCRQCGSGQYFSQGLCGTCHPGAPGYRGSCRDCLAFGVLREHNWLCWGCRGWRRACPVGPCPYCRRTLPLGKAGACRLCWQHALHHRRPGEPLDLAAAGHSGQQLYFANLHRPRSRKPHPAASRPGDQGTGERSGPAPSFTRVRWTQYPLFWLRPGITALKQAAPPDPQMNAHVQAVLREHAAAHGWSIRQAGNVRRSLIMIQAAQHTPGAVIKASEVAALVSHGVTVQSTLEVLAAAGLLDDDRDPAVLRFFRDRTAGLPAVMTAQLTTWFEVMLDGSSQPPRRRPRHPKTIILHIRWMLPALQTWAARGITSLAEITPQDVRAVLPPSGPARSEADQGLRSLFGVLRARKQIFSNPMRTIPVAKAATSIPLPLDTAAIRQALDSADPAVAVAVALAAFHALTGAQIRQLLLTDITDGRLSIGERIIPLAGPVRTRLTAYLDYRNRTWPRTSNPHLLITRKTAPRAIPPGRSYPWANISIRPQALREDRILAEIHASGGDVRRICDLFGMSISGALRYAPPPSDPEDQASR